MKRLLLLLTLLAAPLQAAPEFNCSSKQAGTVLVKGAWAALWAANAAIVWRFYSELSTSNEFRKAATRRGISDLVRADFSKVASSDSIKVVAGGIASVAVAYVLYQEIRKQFSQQETDPETSA